MKPFRFTKVKKVSFFSREDLDELQSMCWQDGYMNMALEGWYPTKKMLMIRCYDKKTKALVGWVFLQKESLFNKPKARLIGVYTSKDFRRKGIAKELLKRILVYAEKRNLEIYTRPWNKAGRTLFNSFDVKSEYELNAGRDEEAVFHMKQKLDELPDLYMP